uniref:Uncharacterized protein n=1 Tax=Gallus gallus TaxID=9031 RepID=A0A8V1A221_CHICK
EFCFPSLFSFTFYVPFFVKSKHPMKNRYSNQLSTCGPDDWMVITHSLRVYFSLSLSGTGSSVGFQAAGGDDFRGTERSEILPKKNLPLQTVGQISCFFQA